MNLIVLLDSLSTLGFGVAFYLRNFFYILALNYYFHQYALPGYHLANIIIHIIAGIILYFILVSSCYLTRED